ncbi:hypothetical protein ACFL4W_02750 [Planctomycetota bacterium]
MSDYSHPAFRFGFRNESGENITVTLSAAGADATSFGLSPMESTVVVFPVKHASFTAIYDSGGSCGSPMSNRQTAVITVDSWYIE